MTVIQGYVMPVPTANKDAYRDYCERFGAVFRQLGGARLVEAWGDDIPAGKDTDFNWAVNKAPDESVVFSWMEFPDEATRAAVFHKMRNDPEVIKVIASDLYDRARMIHAPFTIINEKRGSGTARYMEGCLMPVPLAAKDKYTSWANASNALFILHGAVRAAVAWPDDAPAEYKAMVAAKPDETVTYCWIEWPDKQTRLRAWQALMQDPAMQALVMPFDGSRMIFGGFEPLVEG